jgi:hypothetical protein
MVTKRSFLARKRYGMHYANNFLTFQRHPGIIARKFVAPVCAGITLI